MITALGCVRFRSRPDPPRETPQVTWNQTTSEVRTMPFCPNCRYEYRETARTCPKCNAELVSELPPETQPHVGFAPLDVIAAWLAARRPGLKGCLAVARQDLVSFPRFFIRGAAIVFRHPILYLLPVLLFAGQQYMTYRYVSAMDSRQGYRLPFGFEPREEPVRIGEAIWQRVSSLPGSFAKAFSQGRAGDIARYPLPAAPVPPPALIRTVNPRAPRWFVSRPVAAAYWAVFAFVTALLYAGMFARLKSAMPGGQPQGFLYGMDHFFARMTGLMAVQMGFALAQMYMFRPPLFAHVMRALSPPLSTILFMFAPYAVVVHGVHVHRAIAASVRFVLRHLPAVLALLVGATAAEALVLGVLGPMPRRAFIGAGFVLRGIPASLLLMLLGLCVWGMMMQWYVEATKRESTSTAGEAAPAQVSAD